MTPAAKIAYLSALAAGLIVGGIFGFRTATSNLRFRDATARELAPRVLRDFSYLQYKHADADHARRALQTEANILRQMEGIHPSTEQKIDLAVAYTRLALLADKAQDSGQSHADMIQARRWYLASGRRHLTGDEMKAGLQAFDRRFP